jgi:hypothetical protein
MVVVPDALEIMIEGEGPVFDLLRRWRGREKVKERRSEEVNK